VNPLDVARIGAPVGSEVKVTSPKAMVVLALHTDPGVQRGTAWVPFNQPGPKRVGDLIDLSAAVTDVRIETL
ncbi:MAG TPA: molybdopterin dinucleotide binding domain-containing protein, partial [Ilumatobacteraceae bacterium]|nr:molybdopterin dinucleotide binding domain-containing protein [Ilumatobacteraceae bacterium]